MYRILINLDFYFENIAEKESVKIKLIHELKNMEVEFYSGNGHEDIEKLKRCNIYYGSKFNPEWLEIAKNLFWIIVAFDNENMLPMRKINKNNIVVTTCSTFRSPIDYLILLMKYYIKNISEMNLEYVEQKYVIAMVKRYFNNDRIQNIMDSSLLSENELNDDFMKKTRMYSRNDLLHKFAETGKMYPALNFTANSSCNRNCIFCDAKNHEDKLLTAYQYREIAKEANLWNITKASLSGGEPTLRQDIDEVINALNEGLTAPNKQIGITTNGSLSFNKLDKLIEAGLTSINFSIHSLDSQNYKTIMGSGNPKEIIEKIHYCLSKGLQVKVNCTLMRSYIQDAYEMVLLTKEMPISVRLIELQCIGPAKSFFRDEFISETDTMQTDMFQKIMNSNVSIADRKKLGVRTPGVYYQIEGWNGLFSFISNTSRPFCADCNRIKITPSGRLRACTLDYSDIDLIPFIDNNKMEDAFKYLYLNYIYLDKNPYHKGYHHIDYNLRWNNYNF